MVSRWWSQSMLYHLQHCHWKTHIPDKPSWISAFTPGGSPFNNLGSEKLFTYEELYVKLIFKDQKRILQLGKLLLKSPDPNVGEITFSFPYFNSILEIKFQVVNFLKWILEVKENILWSLGFSLDLFNKGHLLIFEL